MENAPMAKPEMAPAAIVKVIGQVLNARPV